MSSAMMNIPTIASVVCSCATNNLYLRPPLEVWRQLDRRGPDFVITAGMQVIRNVTGEHTAHYIIVTPSSAAAGIPGRCMTWFDASSRDNPASDCGQHLLYLVYSLGAKMLRPGVLVGCPKPCRGPATGIFPRLQD